MLTTTRPRQRTLSLLVFAALTLIGGAWAFATPLGGTPDEKAHVLHAAGVAGGQFFASPVDAVHGTGAVHTVPRRLVDTCGRDGVAEFCPPGPGDDDPVKAGSYVGRYHPAYYAVVGGPLRLWPGMVGLLVARMISVLLVAAVLTAAAHCAARSRPDRAVIPALIVAATPMLFHLTGAVNPNALEIAAGVLLFCAGIAAVEGRDGIDRGYVRLAAVGGIVLATLRGLGPLWLGVAVLALLCGVPRTRLRELGRSPTVRRWGAAVLVAGVAGVLWTVVMRATEGAVVDGADVSYEDAVKNMVLNYLGPILTQMVGNLGYLTTALPGVIVFAWAAVAGLLVVGAAVLGRRAASVRLTVLIAAALVVPVFATAAAVNTMGFFWQGRYGLPLAVGVPIVAAHELAAAGVLRRPAVLRLTRLCVVLLLPAQLVALWLMLGRWQHRMIEVGVGFPVNPLSGTGWRPPLGALAPLVAMLVGLVVLGWCYLRLASAQDGQAEADREPGKGAEAHALPPADPDRAALDSGRPHDLDPRPERQLR